jgi:hypothetical protein
MTMPASEGLQVVIQADDKDAVRVDPVTGTIETDLPDGGVVVQLDAHRASEGADADDPEEFYKNLALEPGMASRLSSIADDLYQSVSADNDSRGNMDAIEARGLELMGIKLQEPNSGVGDTSAPLEGMSSVTNPLLLDACLRSWANAVGELLPANGPVKIKDDGEETNAEDDLADALERDFNHWFTVSAPEYYPDTSHMLLWGTHFKGSGFKKIYRCPLLRRPTSKQVSSKDLIVSDTETDLKSCARITHSIRMRPSVMKRMQMIEAYRDIPLAQPTPKPNAVDEKIAGIQGTMPTKTIPEDQPYTLWESQCELDLDEYAPAEFKGKGIPLPYLVTLDKDSREVLAIRRDWKIGDDQCNRRRMYVRYPYVPGPGFYGTGLLGILGNSTAAMTAAWREALDAGMFASFPGGLMAKLGTRQNTSNFRVAPGEFAAVETSGLPINQVVMGMPYHDVTPGLMQLMDKITAQAEKVGGAANTPTAEGVANTPVGTMLAQIEQATKVMSAAHKGMHQAQSEEIELIAELFRESPEDFWRANKVAPKDYWNEQKFLQALNDCNLVPVSDPNVPSHIHRVMKAVALVQLMAVPQFATRLDPKEVLLRVLRAMKEDSIGLVVDPPPTAGTDPKEIEAQSKIIVAKTKENEAKAKLAMQPQELAAKQDELQTKRDLATVDLAREKIIHQSDATQAAAKMAMADREHQLKSTDQALTAVKTISDVSKAEHDKALGVAQHGVATDQAQHGQAMDVAKHGLDLGQAAHDRTMAEKQHELDKYVAKHPPKPAKPKK